MDIWIFLGMGLGEKGSRRSKGRSREAQDLGMIRRAKKKRRPPCLSPTALLLGHIDREN